MSIASSTSVESFTPSPSYHARLLAFVDVLLVFILFAIDGAWPVPDVNEAHYLVKARHFWEPDWIHGDIFLDSADTHVTFYATFGVLTHLLSLPVAAWCGRLISWGLLAWGWRRLSFALVPRFGWAALSAAAAVAFCERLHMAGEWYIGGFEAKGIAYALVFSAAADVIAGRWNRGLVQFGAASAFHVLVGGWAAAAAGFAWLMARTDRPRLATLWPGLLGAVLISLPGLIPGLALTQGIDSSVVTEAHDIYVHQRLSHHLDARDFSPIFRLRHAALWGIWITLCLLRPADPRYRRLRGIVTGVGMITLIGLAISYGVPESNPWRVSLLRFYWFRPGDVFAAVGTALELLGVAAAATSVTRRRAWLGIAALIGAANLITVCVERAALPMGRGEKLLDSAHLSAWRDVCFWIKANTPADSLFLTPRSFQTFKWYAERPEAAVWKDVPQDARSLIEWHRRLDELYDHDSVSLNYVPTERLLQFAKRYRVRYAVAYREPPLALPPLYQNNEFAVYAFPPPSPAAATAEPSAPAP